MIFLSARDTETVLDWRRAIDCMRNAYGADPRKGNSPGRLIAQTDVLLRCLPAISPSGRYMGTKHIAQPRSGRPTFLIALLSQDDGRLAFLLDAIEITTARTAATSALAVELLSRQTEVDLAVLGSGTEAKHHVDAVAQVVKIRSLTVFSPSEGNRKAFADEFARKLGVATGVSGSPREAVADASLVIAAARSHDETPILFADWLRPDALVVSIGSTVPSQREIDASVVERAAVIFADEPHEVATQTGDMIAAANAGVAFADKLHSLHDLVTGAAGRSAAPAGGLALFKSIGSALQDIALAEWVAETAVRMGLGTELPVSLAQKDMSRRRRPALAPAIGT